MGSNDTPATTPAEDSYNVGGLPVSKAGMLVWADGLTSGSGLLTSQLLTAMLETATQQAMGLDGISDRQIHEIRGGYMVLRNLQQTLLKVRATAEEIRAGKKE